MIIKYLFDLIGIIGVAEILIAFFLLQNGNITNKKMSYQILNFTGALMITISLIYSWNLASFIMELFWMAISLVGMWKIYKDKK